MTEQIITPEDVRVGDRIRIERMAYDILRAQTGTVAKIDMDGDFRSKEKLFIGPAYIQERVNKGEQVTITLLSRPKTPLPTEVGSVIHVSECCGVKCDTLAIVDGDSLWYTPAPVAGYLLHNPSDITAWEPRDVVEVSE